MKIDSNVLVLPSRELSNEDILREVETHSVDLEKQTRDHTLGLVNRMFRTCGTKTRYWLDTSESSLALTLRACRQALVEAGGGVDIDLLIYASVYSELTEPATANLVAHELGLDATECVDIKEACDGWAKAVKFAHDLTRGGRYKRIMVVNGEFSMRRHYAIYPSLFKLTSPEELSWRFPAYTVGEGATATIVSADEQEWRFHNITRNDLVDLCSVTPPWFDTKRRTSEKFAVDGPGLFTSWASELSEKGIPLAIQTFSAMKFCY